MKTSLFWKYFLMGCILLVIITACATATPEPTPIPSTPTAVPPTATSLPPTEVPKPTSCDEVEGNCLELTFDGENCTYKGPAEQKSGAATVLFVNQSDELAFMYLVKHTGDEPLQDSIDYWGGGSTYGVPSWVEKVFNEDASAGKSDFWEGKLGSGINFLICTQGMPDKIWYGGGFSVEN